MLFNSGTTTDSLVARLNRAINADNTDYPLAAKATDVNTALDRFWYLAMLADGTWDLDDTNNTDFPIATTNLVSGQQDYSLPTDVMILEKLLAKDSAGNWMELYPIDIKEMSSDANARSTWLLPTNNTSTPRTYDKFGNSILLDPIPNYNSTNGLKSVYKRGPSYFDSSDTTKALGIPSIFHNFIWRYAALQYAIDKSLTLKIETLTSLLVADEQAIQDFFSHRMADETETIKPKWRSAR